MYSEHVISNLLTFTQGWYVKGSDLDQDLTRITVEIGRIIGPDLGYLPSDLALAWYAVHTGIPVEIGTRAAVHILPDGRCALGLGAPRGVIETRGDQLVLVQRIDPARYTSAYRLPTISYGGLL